VGAVSAEIKELEPQLEEAEAVLAGLLATTPNLPHPSAPDGFTDEDAQEIKRVGEPPSFDFEPKDHVALGEALGVLDVERAVRASGSRFVYLMGDIVFVQFALVRHALDILTEEGFLPVIPPVLVREEAMFGTGMLPDAEGQVYTTAEDDLYLIGTAEVPLAALHIGEIVDESALPLHYAGYSTCFRREAGSYGKDLGGMFRVHQFDKVEMFVFTTPEVSWDEHERLLGIEERIMGNLEIPYRVVNVGGRRPGRARRQEVRHRGLAAGAGPLPGADLVLEHHRLPGAPHADPDAPRRRRHRHPAHVERHGDGDRADADRHHGEPPARRRLRRASRRSCIPTCPSVFGSSPPGHSRPLWGATPGSSVGG
jgi:hypothetical protein